MPSLTQTLPSNDIVFLRSVAALWGIDLASSDPAEAALELAESLCDAELLDEVVSTLPKDARASLEALAAENGRMPWVAFARRFGEVREMGPGKRDREQPQLHPSSAAEVLWYRALLARAFFDTEKGPLEFAFIPDDLYAALDFAGILNIEEAESAPQAYDEQTQAAEYAPEAAQTSQAAPSPEKMLGRPASPAEKACVFLGNDQLLDDACTFLAALRMAIDPPEMRTPAPIVREFLLAAQLISPQGLNPQAVKAFLEAPREKALAQLLESWQTSETFNELRQLAGLSFEGAWANQPLVTREFLLNLLEPVPDEQWWSLPAFIRDIKSKYPDYQRPAGDYDSWFIKRAADGVFLRGFASWDEVDGALIRYLISGPLHWLGCLDLAGAAEGGAVMAFRSKLAGAGKPGPGENAKLSVNSQGKISVPRLVPRAARYQIARFCEWEPEKNEEYHYQISALALKRATEQGLKAGQLLSILRKHAASPVAPSLVKALNRWELNGSEARVENLAVLKVSKPEVLNELRASKAGRFLGEILGPTSVIIQNGAQARVLAALAELGLLAENRPAD